jgi:flagellar hook-length control protein FliK
MPSTIQNLIPVQRNVPKQAKPAENRSEERREDFRQMLDDAAARPAEATDAAPGAAKGDGKKSSGKAAASTGKPKSKDAAAGKGGQGVAEEDLASTEAVDGETAAGAADATGAKVDSEDGDDAGEVADELTADEAPEDEGEDATVVDPSTVANAAAAVSPTTAGAQPDVMQESGEAAGEGAGIGAVSAEKGGRPRVQAVGPQSAEDASEEGAHGEATVLPKGVVAAAGTSSKGGESSGSGEFGSEHASAEPEMTAGRKAGASSMGLGGSPLGARSADEAGHATDKHTAEAQGAASGGQPAPAAGTPLPEFIGPPVPGEASKPKASVGADPAAGLSLDAAAATSNQTAAQGTAAAPKVAGPAIAQPPEVQFADSNHDSIVTGVKAQLMPHGGAMEIRLDPPELGALKVMVEMRDGTMTATFQTSNEEATRLLSHSLNQLKHVLEGQGVSVERLQVQQAPKSDSQSGGDDAKQQQQQSQNWQDEHAARQEQQRKEMLRRMWRRVSGAADPIDVTA